MRMRINKKMNMFGLAISLMLLSVMLTGCVGEQAEEPKTDKGEEAVQQVLRVGISTDVEHWDLTKFPGGDARFVWSQIFGTLVRLGPDLEIRPGLAESWETSLYRACKSFSF